MPDTMSYLQRDRVERKILVRRTAEVCVLVIPTTTVLSGGLTGILSPS